MNKGETIRTDMQDKLGICQWFHYEAYEDVERSVELLRELGIRHLRTGISWADYHRPKGREWYDWQMKQLEDFDVLLSIWHTPPSIAEGAVCNGPPKRLADYADFVNEVIDRYGHQFATLELWNEPNNRYKWDFLRFDPDWSKFSRMIAPAAKVASDRDVPTCLGGMIPVDHTWLRTQRERGVLDHMDLVGIHAFPGMWWPDQPCWEQQDAWKGWEQKVAYIGAHAERPIWVTETGLATCDPATGRRERHQMQADALRAAAQAPVDRLYWYSLQDLDPSRDAIEGFHVDENEYHMGLVTWEGERKPAFRVMKELLAGEAVEQVHSSLGEAVEAGR